MEFSHINDKGFAKMVDISSKTDTAREAVAEGKILTAPEVVEAIKGNKLKKGEVLNTALVAGVMAAKRTWELIPMCHPIILTGVDISFNTDEEKSVIDIFATVKCKGETGVEMEALTAASVAALTIYDMCKAVQRDILIEHICLLKKSGGKSGDFVREEK